MRGLHPSSPEADAPGIIWRESSRVERNMDAIDAAQPPRSEGACRYKEIALTNRKGNIEVGLTIIPADGEIECDRHEKPPEDRPEATHRPAGAWKSLWRVK